MQLSEGESTLAAPSVLPFKFTRAINDPDVLIRCATPIHINLKNCFREEFDSAIHNSFKFNGLKIENVLPGVYDAPSKTPQPVTPNKPRCHLGQIWLYL